MTVNSLPFLLFLAGLCLVYYLLCPLRFRWTVLLAASVGFYLLACAASPVYLFLTSVLAWAGGLWLDRLEQAFQAEKAAKGPSPSLTKVYKAKKKRAAAVMIIAILSMLLVLKYGGFFVRIGNSVLALGGLALPVPSFLAPLGISYYTLIAIGYLLDLYKNRFRAQRNYAKLLLFLAYFPQITQGPFSRYQATAPQLYEGHRFDYHNISWGCQRMLWGFFKKLVVADRMQPMVSQIFRDFEQLSSITCLLGCVYMTVWMYADFSAYMDIVAGASELFGVHIEENFRRPFLSKSLAEFWRRWHITLGAWFREYMFYPLALTPTAVRFGKMGRRRFGVRIGKLFPSLFALFFVWSCTGFWHDASWRYIFWGMANGVVIIGAMVLEPQFAAAKGFLHIREDSRWWNAFCIVRTFLLVSILKVFPGPADTRSSLRFILHLFTAVRMPAGWPELLPGLTLGDGVFLAFSLLLIAAVDLIQERRPVRDALARKPLAVRWCCYLFLIAAVLCMGCFQTSLAGGFAYAQY